MVKIIFLHGYLASARYFDKLRPSFTDTQAFDIIGFGEAEKPDTTYDKQLFMNYLEARITEPCVLIGHSMGAMMAKDFALLKPKLVKKLILINYPMLPAKELQATMKRYTLTGTFLRGGWPARLECHTKAVYKWFIWPIGFLVYPSNFWTFWDGFKHTFQSAHSSLVDYVLKDKLLELGLICKKTLLISGEHDHLHHRKELKRYNSKIIPKMKHQIFGYEKEIAGLIEEFI